MKFIFFLHAPFEGPAALGDLVRQAGHSTEIVRSYAGEQPPHWDEVDVAVAMGGPMNIYQYRDYPWLKSERQWIEDALQRGKKAMGICLGSQILADILGARVYQNQEKEIGWMPIQFSTEARRILPSIPLQQEVLHWHGDTFDLPPDCLRLASSLACENQGFVYQNQILALQFHLEMTMASTELILENCRADLEPGPFVQSEEEIRRLATQHSVPCEKLLTELLKDFLAK